MVFEKVIVSIKDVDMGGETIYNGSHWLNKDAIEKMTNKQIGEYIQKKHGLDYGNTYTYKVRRTGELRVKQSMADGGSLPVGFHMMPDGTIMPDSAHMAKGGKTKENEIPVKVGRDTYEFHGRSIVITKRGYKKYTWLIDGYYWSPIYESREEALKEAVNVIIQDIDKKKKMAEGGQAKPATFKRKVKAISKSLKGKKVPKKYQKEYGKRYNDPESLEAARKIAGAYKKKMEKSKS